MVSYAPHVKKSEAVRRNVRSRCVKMWVLSNHNIQFFSPILKLDSRPLENVTQFNNSVKNILDQIKDFLFTFQPTQHLRPVKGMAVRGGSG